MNNHNGFITHHGLKVRLNPDYCFEYLEREDDVGAWFTSIEAFDSFRGFLSLIGAIILMFTDVSPINAGIIIIALYTFGFVVSQSFTLMGIFNLIYGLIFMVYELLLRFFIPYIALFGVMFITKQYMVLVAFLAARIILFLLMSTINIIQSKWLFSKYGLYIGDVEITAIKLLKFYSKDRIVFKKWMQDYSRFQKKSGTA
ncbi:hypothetical protein [Neobacillus soli]|uniref:hypothetical protein n=1 Tax=Neobacillus soli TaxID=220688 RepID=UPI0008247C7F|nr:hypothetical protein [Neobacillus soli]